MDLEFSIGMVKMVASRKHFVLSMKSALWRELHNLNIKRSIRSLIKSLI